MRDMDTNDREPGRNRYAGAGTHTAAARLALELVHFRGLARFSNHTCSQMIGSGRGADEHSAAGQAGRGGRPGPYMSSGQKVVYVNKQSLAPILLYSSAR